MILRHVFLDYLLCQVPMGWIPHSSTYYHMHVGPCGYVPLCKVPKATTSRGPEWTMLIRLREAPRHASPGAQVSVLG
jgi:hypothetical protein